MNVEDTLSEDPVTVIDILSNSVEFSYFLRQLQRSMLVPYLNQLNNFTLVAPTNSAFARSAVKSGDGGGDDDSLETLNLPILTKEQFQRYIVNNTRPFAQLKGVHILETMPLAGSPVMPIKFQTVDDENHYINGIDVVELDLHADDQDAYVQGIDKALPLAHCIDDVVSNLPNSYIFNSLASTAFNLSGKTVLVPIDSTFNLEEHQLNYLLSSYGVEDNRRIMGSLLIEGIYGGDGLNTTVLDHNGYPLSISSSNDGSKIIINNTIASIQSNILAQDALVHVFDSKAVVQDVEWNAMKTLVGLEAISFVEELILQDLDELITDNSLEQTIFYPVDSNQVSIASKSSNLYHFVTERIPSIQDITKTLYNTRFCNTKKLGSSCQRIKAKKVGENAVMLNGNVLIERGPYTVGNTTIFLTDEDLRTPNDIVSSVNSILHCSKSLSFLENLGLQKLANNHLGYTLFLPCFNSWEDYTLTLNFLKKNMTALEFLMRNHMLNGLLYTDFTDDEVELTNLNGLPVNIKYDGEDSDGQLLKLKYNDDNLVLRGEKDIIFNQGVIHPLNQLIIPEELDISLGDILKSSDADLFLQFISQFPDLETALYHDDYSILLPSTSSLSDLSGLDSNATLEEFLQLHIISPQSIENLYNCDGPIVTLNKRANLTCKQLSGIHSFLQVDNGADNGVRILNRGCTSTLKSTCVYSIDRPISLKWIDNNDHLHISLPGLAVGLGIILGSVLMVSLLGCLMLVLFSKSKKSADTESHGSRPNSTHSECNENTALLSESQPDNQVYNSFESGYSSNTRVNPITFSKKTSPVN